MRHYEIVIIVISNQEKQAATVGERYQKMVTDEGGKVHRFEDWGLRLLAYPIKKQNRARYFLFNIECDKSVIDSLQENFQFSESIARFLITRCDEAVTDESPVLKDIKAKAEEVAEGGQKKTGDRKGRSRDSKSFSSPREESSKKEKS